MEHFFAGGSGRQLSTQVPFFPLITTLFITSIDFTGLPTHPTVSILILLDMMDSWSSVLRCGFNPGCPEKRQVNFVLMHVCHRWMRDMITILFNKPQK